MKEIHRTAGTARRLKEQEVQEGERKKCPIRARLHSASFNNTIVAITDQQGNTISWKSSGSLGFRGSRKGTPFAAQQAAINAANAARDHGLRPVDVRVAAPVSAVRAAIRALAAAGIEGSPPIRDVTLMPHANGCRPPKRRSKRGAVRDSSKAKRKRLS